MLKGNKGINFLQTCSSVFQFQEQLFPPQIPHSLTLRGDVKMFDSPVMPPLKERTIRLQDDAYKHITEKLSSHL